MKNQIFLRDSILQRGVGDPDSRGDYFIFTPKEVIVSTVRGGGGINQGSNYLRYCMLDVAP